ncbi:radical SAM family heme chaperone HemW [Steroidobacter sp.]|uniref:radical SAM family heme chaperone HemW n=1 Tax=Steroidobacter sp. TaxID=1978227 RepID=UPI001A4DAA4D|nr:radical SAM family heme chaperone HemW [Steroidobacter sp.]MBL8271838.1 radical SAM family heme chaperone HemW [Steroidobacter sp.]
MSLALPPLSLYVHMPWCVRKCPYCDFNSHAAPELVPQAQYVDALLEDLQGDVAAAQGRAITSIFFGGGTPSLFGPEQIGRLLAGVRRQIPFAADVEITLEANPGTIEHGRFAGYREAGVNRVSLGAQTFNEEQLRLLGRIHGADDIGRAVDELRQAGIDNFNLDLMYGLPAQSVAQALRDLEIAIGFQPAHISHYQLTLEPGTVFYHRPPALPDPDDCWQMQIESQELLATHGYEQYEVSAYARAGRRSRHNLNYWQFGDYIGIGAGAHGKLTRLDESGAIVRTTRVKQPREYLSRAADLRVSERRVVPSADLPFEFMLNGLRLIDGFDEHAFETRTGLAFAAVDSNTSAAQRKGLLEHDARGHWRPTANGQRFLNDLQELFLPA